MEIPPEAQYTSPPKNKSLPPQNENCSVYDGTILGTYCYGVGGGRIVEGKGCGVWLQCGARRGSQDERVSGLR